MVRGYLKFKRAWLVCILYSRWGLYADIISEIYSLVQDVSWSPLLCAISVIFWLVLLARFTALWLRLNWSSIAVFLWWEFRLLECMMCTYNWIWWLIEFSASGGGPRCIMGKALDCGIILSELELQSRD